KGADANGHHGRRLPAVPDPVLLERQLARWIDVHDATHEAQRFTVELAGVGLDLGADARFVVHQRVPGSEPLAHPFEAPELLPHPLRSGVDPDAAPYRERPDWRGH